VNKAAAMLLGDFVAGLAGRKRGEACECCKRSGVSFGEVGRLAKGDVVVMGVSESNKCN